MELKFSRCIVQFTYILHYVYSERHHLQFVYTILTKPDWFSGPVFSAVGLYDDRQISHYSNEEQTWNIDCLDAENWRDHEKPHDPRVWFINLVNALANCTSSRCEGLHTLQRRIGCEVDKHPDGSVKIVNAFDEYGYDGEDFIAFDIDAMQWKDKSPKAKETKKTWDTYRFRNQDLQSYLNKCMDWISTFNASISNPPALYMFTSAAPHDQSKLILTCLSTGFYPKLIQMNITLNNITLQPFSSTGVRPNNNQSFQIRTSVEIHRDEKQSYECHVLHSGQTFTKSRDGSLESRSHIWIAAAGAFFAVAVLCIFRRKKGQMNYNGSTTEHRESQRIS
ncbi:hypothetical protein Q8A67_015965 [Cirrhinus molitorella]|uniref:Immunoglobulin C1-set domain-containing protein n=1 Tax=Cirrhinus molitorella TaxID=172907 RepID=A0AA88TTW8_9TELE|nr:hypothetical protein Q8A67_015965 [Cirrhinus molitorella]